MIQSNTPVRDAARSTSIWLLVQVKDQARVFEFVPNNDRCVVIGSAGGADVRLDGIAPIALYVQRDGTGVRLIPAYLETGLRLNAQPVTGQCFIQHQALVELLGHQIALRISEVCPIPAAATDACGHRMTVEPRAYAQNGQVQSAPSGPSHRTPAKTFVLGSSPLSNPVEPSVTRNGTAIEPVAAVAPNSIEPTPILALGSEPGRRAPPHGTQALSPSELAAIRAMVPAAQRPAREAPPAYPPVVPPSPLLPELPPTTGAESFDHTRQSASSEAYRPASASELPKVIPFEPMRVEPVQTPDPKPSGRSGSKSTVVEVQALSPSAVAAQPQALWHGTPEHGLAAPPIGVGHSSGARRPDGHYGISPPPTNSDRVHALAMPARSASGSGFARLGELTKRYPVGVIGGAIVGSLMLIVFFVGAAQLLRPNTPQRAVRRTTVSAASPANPSAATSVRPSALASPGNASPGSRGAAAEVATPGNANPGSRGAAAEVATPGNVSPSKSDPNQNPPKVPVGDVDAGAGVQNAAGHLFTNRLPEAEQAYRELAATHPDAPIFATVARLLAKRNSPDCRSQNNTQKSCPTVKP